jgi:hypothetical protein
MLGMPNVQYHRSGDDDSPSKTDAADGSGAFDCYVAFVPGQLENMLTAIAPLTPSAKISSMTMYGIQRPDAEATEVPHSRHTKVRLA